MKKQILSIFALCGAFVFCVCCAPSSEEPEKTPQTPQPTQPVELPHGGYSGTEDGVSFVLPDLGEVTLHTPLQEKYLRAKGYADIMKYADGNNFDEEGKPQELSHPLPVTFTWEISGAEGESVTLDVGEGEQMAEKQTFTTTEETLDVYNFKVGTTYYGTVTVGGTTSGQAYFSTKAGGPRNLYVDGVANVRDVGGWATADGKTVRQGLMYRCGRLNVNYSGETSITEQGIATMLDIMKIRTELDLRGGVNDPSEYGNKDESALGPSVDYHHIGMNWEGNLLRLNHAELKEIFSILAKESSYPLIFHCSIGTDRTGIVSYLLLGLLGVSEADIARDYLFSNFAYIEGTRDMSGINKTYVADIKAKEGDTLSQKVRATLCEIGVTEAELDEIVRIFGCD